MSALLERATGADAEHAESIPAFATCELPDWAFVEHFSGCRESTLATADIKQRVQCSRCQAWLKSDSTKITSGSVGASITKPTCQQRPLTG